VIENEAKMKSIRPNYDRTSYILIVDDDDILLKFFKIHLNKFFSKVIVVRSAKQVTEVLKEKLIDLVISDVYLPGANGFQIARKVRKHDPSIPILFISGALLTPEEEEEISKSDGFLSKPFSMEELHDFIQSGLLKRKKINELLLMLSDKEELKTLFNGKMAPEKLFKSDQLKEARKLMKELKIKSAA
jgi:DNA-binding NtrC family response regulator